MKKLEDFYNESPTKRKTRLTIIQEAAKFFSDIGIDVVSITDIAQKSDITIRNLYRYYASKEFLVIDVAYHLLYKSDRFSELNNASLLDGIDQLALVLNHFYEIEKSDDAGLSLTKFVMYFDLYLYNMGEKHPAYLKYIDDYAPNIQEVGSLDIKNVLIQGIDDGSIDLRGADVDMTVEYIIQSLLSVIMRTLIKESENKKINHELVEQHIKVLVDYYRNKEKVNERH